MCVISNFVTSNFLPKSLALEKSVCEVNLAEEDTKIFLSPL